jgi:hypothetical protein
MIKEMRYTTLETKKLSRLLEMRPHYFQKKSLDIESNCRCRCWISTDSHFILFCFLRNISYLHIRGVEIHGFISQFRFMMSIQHSNKLSYFFADHLSLTPQYAVYWHKQLHFYCPFLVAPIFFSFALLFMFISKFRLQDIPWKTTMDFKTTMPLDQRSYDTN